MLIDLKGHCSHSRCHGNFIKGLYFIADPNSLIFFFRVQLDNILRCKLFALHIEIVPLNFLHLRNWIDRKITWSCVMLLDAYSVHAIYCLHGHSKKRNHEFQIGKSNSNALTLWENFVCTIVKAFQSKYQTHSISNKVLKMKRRKIRCIQFEMRWVLIFESH